MVSFSRKAIFLLALGLFATLGLEAQSTSSDPQPPAAPAPTQTQTQPQTQAPISVQGRIRARREQRREAAIHDVYSHLFEGYAGAGFLRTIPGPGVDPGKGLQHYDLYSWDVGVTRYFNQRLGVTLDGRGSFGTAYIGNNPYNVNHPAISQYSALLGPTYRLVLKPKYSVSARILGGGSYGNFSGDTNHYGTALLGLYPDGASVAISASLPVEYNISPSLGIRAAPEYFLTNFGGTIQNARGVWGGVVYRWGKQ